LYVIRRTGRFVKDLKRLARQGKDLGKLDALVSSLAAGEPLDPRREDHPLKGSWAGFRDCHVEPDWLLLYAREADVLVLVLTRTGSHAELGL
jgi:mRNA interferase YafQ